MKERKTVRFTTFISRKHLRILEEASKRTGYSKTELIGLALEDYLMKLREECKWPDLPGRSKDKKEE